MLCSIIKSMTSQSNDMGMAWYGRNRDGNVRRIAWVKETGQQVSAGKEQFGTVYQAAHLRLQSGARVRESSTAGI